MPHRTKWSVCPTQVRMAGVDWFKIGRCGTPFRCWGIRRLGALDPSGFIAAEQPGKRTLLARSPVNVKPVTTLSRLGPRIPLPTPSLTHLRNAIR